MAETGTIDSLAIEIGASSQNAAQEIDKLAAALTRLKQAVSGRVPNMEKWATELNKVADASKQIDSAALAKTASAFAKLNAIKDVKIPKGLPESLRNIALSVRNVTPEAVENLDRMTRSLQRLGNVRQENIRAFSLFRVPKISENAGAGLESIVNAIRNIPDSALDKLQRFGEIMKNFQNVDFAGLGKFATASLYWQLLNSNGVAGDNTAEVAKNSSVLQRFSDSAKPAIDALAKLISGFLSAAKAAGKFTKNLIAAPFKAFSNKVKNLTGSLGNLISSFKRILFYRTIRTVIKEIGEAFAEGQKNAYWYSREVGEATRYISEAYDAFATASLQMKNQIGAAWATLYANIEPIIEKIVSLVTKAAQVVTQFFAALGGKSSYLRAVEYPTQWAEAAEDAADATKQWKNQLMGFDEINKLEDQSKNGRNANSDLADYASMFEEVPIDSPVSDLAQRMKDLWNKQDWKGLGELIGNTLNNLFPSREQWEAWGDKIGGFLDGIIQTIYYTLKTIDFYEWGNRIASGLNHLINSIDFYVLGALFVRKFTAMWDFIIGFLSGVDFYLVGEKISAFFRGAFDEATSWLQQFEWKEAGEAFKQKVIDFMNGVHIEDLANSIGKFFFEFNISVADFIRGMDIGQIAADLGGWIARGIDNIDLGGIMVSLANLVADILLEIPNLLMGLEVGMKRIGASIFRSLGLDWVADILDGMADKMNSSRQEVKGFTDMLEKNIRETMLESVGGGHGKLGRVGEDSAKDLIDGMETAVGSHYSGKFGAIGSEAAGQVKSGWESEFNGLEQSVTTSFSHIESNVQSATKTIKDASVSDAKQMSTDMSAAYKEIEDASKNTFGTIEQEVPSTMESMVQQVNANIQTMLQDVQNTFAEITRVVQESVNNIKHAMDFEWSIPRPKIPKITWTYETVHSGDGSSYQIPQFDVHWFAKGGVLDKATLFGLGDAGAEAIVPLERNTEWIGKVAAEMNRQQDANPSSRDQAIVDALYDAAAQMVAAFRENGQRPVESRVYINGREFYRATYNDRKAVDNEHGISLISY